jgi:hypothetical protein
MAEEKPKHTMQQEWSDKLRALYNEINSRQLIIKRQDGTTVLGLPGVAALVVAVIIPQLAAVLLVAHLLEMIKVEIKRTP